MEKETKKLIEKLQHYVKSENVEDYKKETFILDVLYFLGLSINEENRYAEGFKKFRKEIEELVKEK